MGPEHRYPLRPPPPGLCGGMLAGAIGVPSAVSFRRSRSRLPQPFPAVRIADSTGRMDGPLDAELARLVRRGPPDRDHEMEGQVSSLDITPVPPRATMTDRPNAPAWRLLLWATGADEGRGLNGRDRRHPHYALPPCDGRGGTQARSKGQALGACCEGIRAFKSLPPHSLSRRRASASPPGRRAVARPDRCGRTGRRRPCGRRPAAPG